MMAYDVTRVVDEDGNVYWNEGHLTSEEVKDAFGENCVFAYYKAGLAE